MKECCMVILWERFCKTFFLTFKTKLHHYLCSCALDCKFSSAAIKIPCEIQWHSSRYGSLIFAALGSLGHKFDFRGVQKPKVS